MRTYREPCYDVANRNRGNERPSAVTSLGPECQKQWHARQLHYAIGELGKQVYTKILRETFLNIGLINGDV